MQKFDIAIIGGGVSGVSAVWRAAEKFKKEKIILLELGQGPAKRRRFLEGFLGALVQSDGKWYPNDIEQIADTVDGRHLKAANNWVMKKLEEVNPMKLIKDKAPSAAIQKKIENAKFKLHLNDYIQWKPESIHQLSKLIVKDIEDKKNITLSFNNEVYKITKQKSGFILSTSEMEDIFCKKVLLALGRSGWRFVNKTFHDFGLIVEDNIASYGITIEMSAQHLKDFNKSHCFLQRNDMEIGHFNWNGTVIPEDHADLVISAFRSNEDRWKSDKVSFPMICFKEVEKNQGINQTDRLGKLAFLLFNDRVGKEKVRTILNDTSSISCIPEYQSLKKSIEELSDIIPSLESRAYFHAPTILPLAAHIRLSTNLETEIEDMHVCGESAGVRGLMGAAVSGVVAIDGM